MRRKCEFCGEEIEEDELFCKGCGNPINNSKEVKDAVIDNKKENNNFVAVIIIILLILIIIGGFFLIK